MPEERNNVWETREIWNPEKTTQTSEELLHQTKEEIKQLMVNIPDFLTTYPVVAELITTIEKTSSDGEKYEAIRELQIQIRWIKKSGKYDWKWLDPLIVQLERTRTTFFNKVNITLTTEQ